MLGEQRHRVLCLSLDPTYIQLGLAPSDMEADLLVPLRDAVVTWTPTRDLGLKIGQQKVPFNRERMVSSSAQQFPDRSITNAELTLDRDIGAQLFSNDLFGWNERLAYQVGVFNGDGRNRAIDDLGLLYVARVEVRPLGAFDDSYVDADITRGAPRLVFAAGVARNMDTVRSRSTHGDVYALEGFTQDSAEADVMFKARGLAVHAQGIVRRADGDTVTGDVDGVATTETSRSAWGWSAAVGYTFENGLEPAMRIAQVEPLPGHVTDVVSDQELRVGLSWYGHGHDLKLQTDYGYLGGDAHPDGAHEVRSQLQVYF